MDVQGVNNRSSVEGSNSSSQGSSYLFNTNFILLVMKYTNIAMEHQAYLVELQGQVESIATKIQGDLATISEFLSQMEGQAGSGGAWVYNDNYSPNSANGFDPSFYHMNENATPGSSAFGSDSGPGCVSAAYQQGMAGFISALKDLFGSSSTGTGPTVAQLSSITNPYGGADFNMNSYWNNLQGSSYFQQFSKVGFNVVSANPSDHASLLQQYMYAQAQLTVNSSSKATIESANGDISQLVDFNPSDPNCDTNVQELMQVLSSLNTNVDVARNSSDFEFGYVSNKTGNILQMISQGDMYNTPTPGQSDYYQPGLYAAFSYMAFNYIWTKNPNMNVSDQTASNDPNQPGTGQDFSFRGAVGSPQSGSGDILSGLYTNTNTTQSTLSSSGTQANQQFQQGVNGVQQLDNVAQNVIQGYGQATLAEVGNWKSA